MLIKILFTEESRKQFLPFLQKLPQKMHQNFSF
jgi:hypothetical protein